MIISANSLTVGEKFSVGGVTTLLGLGMTFLVLALLILCIILVGFIVKKLGLIHFPPKKKKKNDTAEQIVDDVVEKPVEEIDPETLVAVESAVKAYVRETATDGKPHENIVVKSVVRK